MSDLTARLLDALVLAEILPDDLPMPAIIQDGDGDLSMEWYAGTADVANIWMRDRRVSYAGMVNGKSMSGCSSDRAILSPQCLALIRAVVERAQVNAARTTEQ